MIEWSLLVRYFSSTLRAISPSWENRHASVLQAEMRWKLNYNFFSSRIAAGFSQPPLLSWLLNYSGLPTQCYILLRSFLWEFLPHRKQCKVDVAVDTTLLSDNVVVQNNTETWYLDCNFCICLSFNVGAMQGAAQPVGINLGLSVLSRDTTRRKQELNCHPFGKRMTRSTFSAEVAPTVVIGQWFNPPF